VSLPAIALATALGLGPPSAAAPSTGAAVPAREVRASTAAYAVAVSTSLAGLEELKRLVDKDKRQLVDRREGVKRARRRGDPRASAQAEEAWRKAKEQLHRDREVLRQAIEARGRSRSIPPSPAPSPTDAFGKGASSRGIGPQP